MANRPMNRQRGVFLIEALVGILIFSVGILALIAMQAAAISAQTDAQFRTEAAKRAEQITSQMWVNIDRTTATTSQTTLATFQHRATGAISSCNFTGAASANTLVTSWVNTVTTGTTALPGTSASMLQITVDTSSGAFNKVSVTVCWKATADAAARRHTVVTYVN